jgi:ubiquinone/menaquinone biosynthesis C-methylase UbiE
MDLNPEKVLNAELWEMHLTRQFSWTKKLRSQIYRKVDMKNQKKILDVGCGIGLISKEIFELGVPEVHGIDLNPELIKKAKEKFPQGNFVTGNAENLPFEDNTFDCATCHFVLMWVKNPYKAVFEMKRVVKPGGWIICASEPDYGAKIDYPDEFNAADATVRAIRNEGADPYFGRKLKAVMSSQGLTPKMGVSTDLWDDKTMRREFEHVWKFSEMTAKGTMMKNWVKSIRKKDEEALNNGTRITLLPLFWAIAKK